MVYQFAAGLGPLQQRRIRRVRLLRRPGADEPSHRHRLLQKLSSKEKNYVADGFYARTPAEELKCPDLELNVLMSIEDVTERVNAAVRPGSSLAEAEKARRAAMNTIEQESLEKTGLRSDVVTLYQGGLYHLYRYKKYTDVRLVFAPEQDIAFFGGDPDNFEYPRYDLDICFFRVYENGNRPGSSTFLNWSPQGCSEGDLVFVPAIRATPTGRTRWPNWRSARRARCPSCCGHLRGGEVLLAALSAAGRGERPPGRRGPAGRAELAQGPRGANGGAARPGDHGAEGPRKRRFAQAVAADPSWPQLAAAPGTTSPRR